MKHTADGSRESIDGQFAGVAHRSGYEYMSESRDCAVLLQCSSMILST